MSFMTGRHVHRNPGGWDNTSHLSRDVATWTHAVRAVGYDCVLAGKQHFPDPQYLHGFRAQLAFDLHASQTHGQADWSRGVPVAAQPWPGVTQAGPGRTRELDVDDGVTQAAVRYITEMRGEDRPWAMNVGYIAPHVPLIAPQRFWDVYDTETIDLPVIPPGHLAALPPAMHRMRAAFGLADFTDDEVRRARHGYYALCTYLDEQVGILLGALEATGQLQDTVVIYTSDHGEMAGEHGMWRKSNFYEQSVRVPLIMSWPGALPSGREVRCRTWTSWRASSTSPVLTTSLAWTGRHCFPSLATITVPPSRGPERSLRSTSRMVSRRRSRCCAMAPTS
jgi:choline-sulfatase